MTREGIPIRLCREYKLGKESLPAENWIITAVEKPIFKRREEYEIEIY